MLSGVGAALGGYRLGLLARVSSWIGLAGGLFAASRVLPSILRALHDATANQLLLVSVGTLVGAGLLGQGLGLVVGNRLHATLPRGGVRSVDRAAGSIAGILGVVVGLWLILPLMADVPGWFAAESRSSAVAGLIHDRLPDAPDTVDTLRRLLGDDQYPRVFDALDRSPEVGPVPTSSEVPDGVVDAVVPSMVSVEGVACRRVQEGSGFVVGPNLVVTNAHVVAGEDSTTVRRTDAVELKGDVVAFDPDRDLAVLRVPGLDRPGLTLGDTSVDGRGAAFGHPGGGALRAAPFQVGQVVTATGTDIYDKDRTSRQVLVLAAELRPGDSGAPLIDAGGSVVGVAFAIAPDRPGVAYALAIDELEAVLASDLTRVEDTGPCLS